jgi:hypothetical protein
MTGLRRPACRDLEQSEFRHVLTCTRPGQFIRHLAWNLSLEPELLLHGLATGRPKMILEACIIPGQSGAPGRIRPRDPLLRSMFHAAVN